MYEKKSMESALLELLEKDNTLSIEHLALTLNAPRSDVAEAIKQLEAANIIVKHQTIVNWEKAGIEKVTAVIDVKITPQREVGFDAIAERIYRFPEVRSLYLMSGAYDLLVMVEGANLKQVSKFVAHRLATIDGVVSTTTHFMLKPYKEDGVILDDREEDHRLAVSP
ncbi:MAG TPA: Lrp/AsnC family transcriptional regulator [Methylomusa anaerophila]|uniref:DNA-binding transcriptional regulator AsnC n=1 Tax=Methylomusa anaerophila TaxID=1930071 RepID=A0A348AHJ9_9FIRM|nr:Lrp/AsnC family transcriptional regulator [Methylomusa anaerophila]BBB90547.1 DNA-binding transcriptional regulator AsnC [Methylomusa anaerophila]HML88847.1 Lrp/AsnC family transcriptional regulator [Methylomusa anaerophila]